MDIHPPLIELLGGHWRFEQPVTAAAWSGDGSVAAFGLGDGTVALARARWPGGPEVRARASGGLEVHPPPTPNPPVSRLAAHSGACRALVAEPGAGFLSGGEDGRVLRIGRDGTVEPDAELAVSRVDLLAAGAAGWRACAAGREVILAGRSRTILTLPGEATALGFDAAGRRLAVAYVDGASIWSDDGAPLRRRHCRGGPQALAWSPDDAWLALGLTLGPDAGGVRAWRLADGVELIPGGESRKVGSLGFSFDGLLLAASGAPRVLYWRLDARERAAPRQCGLPSSRAPVRAVAFHPSRPLIAAGYASGAVLLCRPGSDDVLFIKGAGGGPTLTLAWSLDGEHLALATEGGEAGLVFLPDSLFRDALGSVRAGERYPVSEPRA